MQTKKNLDGIQNQRLLTPAARAGNKLRRQVLVDSVVKSSRCEKFGSLKAYRTVYNVPFVSRGSIFAWRPQLLKAVSRQKVPLLASVAALFLAFGGGMWFVLNTGNSKADTLEPQVLGASTSQPPGPIVMTDAQLPPANSVNNDVLFNTPIEYLKQYLAEVSQPEVIALRAQQIKQYLEQKNSPLASASETIAAQPHWDIIMAVAFAESSFGKNCSDNNCSNIGVKPGAPSWRRYSSYDAWVVDFNRLLDKKYKDWTLKQMCGVYVKPCNPNWLLATQQVLDQMQAEHIE